MNIMYLHGFGSRFDANSTKIQELGTLGNVHGPDIDYTQPDVVQKVSDYIAESNDVDLVVGTSLGGWLASHIGSRFGIPFVACNPSTNPSQTLLQYVGTGTDYTNKEYTLTTDVVEAYVPIATNGCGLILLDEDDELLDSVQTSAELCNHYMVTTFSGGSHRFEHMSNSLDIIAEFVDNSSVVYGLG